MAERVVLSEMVVKLTADTADFQRKVGNAQESTKRAAREIEASGGRSFGRIGKIFTRGLGPLGNVAEGVAGGGAGGLGGLAGLGLAIAAVKDFTNRWHEANQVANKAIMSVVSGARTMAQAMSDVKVESLSRGLEKLTKVMNPEGIGDWWEKLKVGTRALFTGRDSIQVGLDDAVSSMDRASAAARRFGEDARLQARLRQIADERTMQASRDASRALEEQAQRAGEGALRAGQLEQAQNRARQTSTSLAQASRDLAGEFRRQAAAQEQINRGQLRGETIRGLREQAQLSDLVGGAQARMAEAFRLAHADGISVAQAMRRYARELEEIRELTDQVEAVGFNRGLREQIETFGLSAEQAQLYRLRMRGVAESTLTAAAANVEQLRTLRLLQQPARSLTLAQVGSAEQQARAIQQARQIAFVEATAGLGVLHRPLAAGIGVAAPAAGSAEAGAQRARQDRMIDLLGRIERNTSRGAAQPAPANLNGG